MNFREQLTKEIKALAALDMCDEKKALDTLSTIDDSEFDNMKVSEAADLVVDLSNLY